MARRGGHFGFSVPEQDAKPIDRATVRRVVRTFRPYRGKLAVVGAAIVVTSILGVVNPLLIKVIFGQVLFGNAPGHCAGLPCPRLILLSLFVALMIAIPVVSE